MNWDAISAISETLGAMGVIVTVIYLAVQIRQNTKSIEGSTEQALMTQEMDMYALLAQHPNVYRRGCESLSELDEDEVVVFEHLVMSIMSQMYSAYVQYQRGLIPASVWNPYLEDWGRYVGQSGFQRAWAEHKNYYPAEFLKALGNSPAG